MIFEQLFILYAGVFGLIIGSFFNALEYRLSVGESVVRSTQGKASRSKCPQCQHTLGVHDLIPVFSYLFLGGKCRYCKQSISIQYPAVELATAAVWAMAFWYAGTTIQAAVIAAYGSILLFIFLYDLKHQMILDAVSIPAIVVTFFCSWLVREVPLNSMLIGAVMAGGFFALQYILSKGKWIGGGDIRFGILMGFMLGWQNTVLALILAYVSGAVIGIVLLLRKKAEMQSRLAFGTFLSAATFVSLLYGEEIINWYIDFLV